MWGCAYLINPFEFMAASLRVSGFSACRALELGQRLQYPSAHSQGRRGGGGWRSLPLSWRSAAASLEVTICITVRAGSLKHLHLRVCCPQSPFPTPS